MKYLLVIDGFGRFKDFDGLARVFRSPWEAMAYVSKLHQEAWDEERGEFKEGVEWDGALLYQISKDGTLLLFDEYDTTANGTTGEAIGWRTT